MRMYCSGCGDGKKKRFGCLAEAFFGVVIMLLSIRWFYGDGEV